MDCLNANGKRIIELLVAHNKLATEKLELYRKEMVSLKEHQTQMYNMTKMESDCKREAHE